MTELNCWQSAPAVPSRNPTTRNRCESISPESIGVFQSASQTPTPTRWPIAYAADGCLQLSNGERRRNS